MANRTKTVTTDVESGTVTLTWADGEKTQAKLGELPEHIVRRLALHGLKQKLVDAHAGVRDVADARAATVAVLETLRAGDWSKRPDAGVGGLLVEAVARATGRTAEAVRERLAAMDDAQRRALAKHPAVAAAMAAIRAERLAARAAGDVPALDF